MGIFTMDDPLTTQYIEKVGFKTNHKQNDPTILYRMRLYKENWWSEDMNAELRFYWKAAKKSKQELCELSYKYPKHSKSKMMRYKLRFPKTCEELDWLIYEAKTIFAKEWNKQPEDIKISTRIF